MGTLEQMLVAAGGQQADIVWASGQPGGLGVFIRSLVGLDRAAAVEAFGHFLATGSFTVDQVRFVDLIIDELTANGSMEPLRLFESPYTDHAPTGPTSYFSDTDVNAIVEVLHQVRTRAKAS